jgi:hypothetical protein
MSWNRRSIAILLVVLASATAAGQQGAQREPPVWEIGLADKTVFNATSIGFHKGVRYALYFRQGGPQPTIQVLLGQEDAVAVDVPLIEVTTGSRDSAQSPFTFALTGGRSLTGRIHGQTFEGRTKVQGFPATVPEPIENIRGFQVRIGANSGVSATVMHFSGPDALYDEFWWVRPDRPFDCGEQTGTSFRLTIASGATLEVPAEQITSAKITPGKFAGEALVDLVLRDDRVMTGTTRLGVQAEGNHRGFSASLRVCSPERLSYFRKVGP